MHACSRRVAIKIVQVCLVPRIGCNLSAFLKAGSSYPDSNTAIVLWSRRVIFSMHSSLKRLASQLGVRFGVLSDLVPHARFASYKSINLFPLFPLQWIQKAGPIQFHSNKGVFQLYKYSCKYNFLEP